MKSPRHRDGQPESLTEAFGLVVHIDRHAGTVLEGIGPDGQPYHVIQRVPYGYLPGVLADDDQDFDVYLGSDPKADRVYVVTQCKASNGHYDEPKGMLGFPTMDAAADCYRAHTHERMFGRIGTMTLDAFKTQLDAWKANPVGTFRPETEEDATEAAEMDALEAALAADPDADVDDEDPPPSSEEPDVSQPDPEE